LQTLLDEFVEVYNTRRPHRSLPHWATSATIYASLPKATPSKDRSADTHDRVRHDKIDKAGSVTLRLNGQLLDARHSGTSASAEPTPEPTSSRSPKTSTSPSRTPPPAKSCAT
jgi:hypothetical protein